MKNLHYLKKFVVMVLAAMMTLSTFALPTFAAKDSQIVVKGVESGATVTAYKIVEEGNGGWEAIDFDGTTVTITATEKDGVKTQTVAPTAQEIATIASKVTGGTKLTASGDDYVSTANALDPGLYLILVTETSGKYVYNPMVVGLDYDGANNTNQITAGEEEYFTVGETEVYAKKSEPSLDKKIVNTKNANVTNASEQAEGTDAKKFVEGDTAKVGDEVSFVVDTQIPSYSTAYTNPQFVFKDTLKKGLSGYGTSIVVKEGNKTLVEGADKDYTVTKGDKTFSINFKVTPGEKQRDIRIEYSAFLDDTAFTAGFDPKVNEARIKYTYDREGNTKEIFDETQHYTFSIDGNLIGPDGGLVKETEEVLKVESDGTTTVIETTTREEVVGTGNGQMKPLANAVFELLDKQGNVVRVAVTDDRGMFKEHNGLYKDASGNYTFEAKTNNVDNTKVECLGFVGLNAGEYDIQEKVAPTGYKLKTTKVPVSITAVIDGEGYLKSYNVNIGGASSTYTWKAEQEGGAMTVVSETTNKTYLFPNNNVGTLPSTGGMGTVLFTVAGAAIMALALFLLFGGKKKQHQK